MCQCLNRHKALKDMLMRGGGQANTESMNSCTTFPSKSKLTRKRSPQRSARPLQAPCPFLPQRPLKLPQGMLRLRIQGARVPAANCQWQQPAAPAVSSTTQSAAPVGRTSVARGLAGLVVRALGLVDMRLPKSLPWCWLQRKCWHGKNLACCLRCCCSHSWIHRGTHSAHFGRAHCRWCHSCR